MADGWLCDACRSLNKSRDKRCYSCRVPRRGVEHQPGTAGIARGVSGDTPTPLALAVRGGARYRPSWMLAAVIIPLIVVVAILDAMLWPALIAMLRVDGSFAGNPATTPLWGRFAIEMGAMVAAGFLWSVWMAVCLSNIPALTGRWPGFGTSDALLAPLGRRSGYYRPMHVVREVVDHFAGGRVWPNLLVTAWWAAWLGSIIVPAAIATFRNFVLRAPPRDMFGSILLRPYLVAIAAVLAIGVVIVVEWLQHQARVGLAATLDAGQPLAADPVAQGRGRHERGATLTAVVMAVAVIGSIAAVAFVGTGAQPGPRSGDSARTTTSGPSPTPGPSHAAPTPTPSSAPVEHPVIARMLAYTHDPALSGRWQMRTEIEAGDWTAETARFDVARSGGDGWTRLWALQPSGALRVTEETALIGGRARARAPDQPWNGLPAGTDTRPPVVVGAEAWDHLTYEGRVRKNGERLHRIGFERYGVEVGQGFEDAFAERQGTVTTSEGWILVRDDGTPVLLAARVNGQIDGVTPTVVRVTTTYRDMGSPVPISLSGMPPAVP